MTFQVYDGRRVVYETLEDARAHAQAAIDECRKQSTVYEWPSEVSEIAVYEAPDDCGEPWRDGTLVLEARERVVEDENHPLGRYSEFDLVDVRPWKVNVAESYVGALSPTGGPGGSTELVDEISLAEYKQSATETVEVWSNDPSVNGSTLIVSTPLNPGDSFELVVADLLPDDDDGGEEPGAMCRRALAKAEASGALMTQVATMFCRPGDLETLERDEASRRNIIARAREIIDLVRATPAPDTITLSLDQLTSALREAAAFGTYLSSCSSTTAGAVRQIADVVLRSIAAGITVGEAYDTLLEAERRIGS